jgi:uncharacterized membrane protein
MALIAGSTICFSLGNCLMNVVGERVPPMQSAFFRFLVQTVVSVISTALTHRHHIFCSSTWIGDSKNAFKIILRSCLGSTGLVCWFTALQMIHLADATAINYFSIPFTSILAYFILHEPYRFCDVKCIYGLPLTPRLQQTRCCNCNFLYDRNLPCCTTTISVRQLKQRDTIACSFDHPSRFVLCISRHDHHPAHWTRRGSQRSR